MLSPGSKNWIEMFYSLIDERQMSAVLKREKGISAEALIHARLFQSGIVFGYPSQFVFLKDTPSTSWTLDEKIKVLLFECFLYIYLIEKKSFDREDFENSLLNFYADYKEHYSLDVLQLFVKETTSNKVEKILTKRTHKKKSWANMFWVNYLSNGLVFLDVIAYRQFLNANGCLQQNYNAYVDAVIKTVVLASIADGSVEQEEKKIYDVLISSASITAQEKQKYLQMLSEQSIQLSSIDLHKDDTLFNYYLLDVATLTVCSDLTTLTTEKKFLKNLASYLGISQQHLESTLIIIENYVIENNKQVSFLGENNAYERLYLNFSRRWIKVLGRNKDKLVEELKNNKELVELVNKSMIKELTPEEKEKVKTQFKDLVKSMPAVAIFMLPGGALLLPLITRIVPDLLPSSFQSNQIKKEK